ncbi:MAG: hypothetical protein OER86_11330, partial [Phycisphaerae bacterium]|nr:hypothetical protein [Phycisphaerae bacterium]
MRESQGGKEVWFGVLFGLLLLAGLALLVLGVYLAFSQREYTVLALALLTIVVTASAYALAGREQQAELLGQLQDQNRLLDLISERLLISDQAKRIAYRQKDR